MEEIKLGKEIRKTWKQAFETQNVIWEENEDSEMIDIFEESFLLSQNYTVSVYSTALKTIIESDFELHEKKNLIKQLRMVFIYSIESLIKFTESMTEISLENEIGAMKEYVDKIKKYEPEEGDKYDECLNTIYKEYKL